MESEIALRALGALSHPTRLDVFRLLMRAGPGGMLVNELGTLLDVRQNTLSTNLGQLAAAGLVRSRREGRAVRYVADLGGIRALLAFLLEDCCGGRPELCRPALDALTEAPTLPDGQR